MMLEIAQHVMSFLHKHDRPPVSLHQEMVLRQKEKEMIRKKQLEEEELEWRMKDLEEVRGGGWIWEGRWIGGRIWERVDLGGRGNEGRRTGRVKEFFLLLLQHRKIEEEIKRKEAELRDRKKLELNSDEDEEESDVSLQELFLLLIKCRCS